MTTGDTKTPAMEIGELREKIAELEERIETYRHVIKLEMLASAAQELRIRRLRERLGVGIEATVDDECSSGS